LVALGAGNPAATVNVDLVPMPIYFSGYRSYGPLSFAEGNPLAVVVRDPVANIGKMSAYIALRKNDGSWYSFVFSGGQLVMVPGLIPVVASAEQIPSGSWRVLTPPLPVELRSEDHFWIAAAVFPADSRVTLDNWRDKALGYADETVRNDGYYPE
jgi:hypothetical protein